jgi:glycosyltransferase involved in cell wall biosynthesis
MRTAFEAFCAKKMKVAFYCPLKPISHPNPSGDREIARGLFEFFQDKELQPFILSEFRTKEFYLSPLKWLEFIKEFYFAFRKVRRENPDCFFTYHLYYKAPDPIASILAWWFQKPYFVLEGMYSRKAARNVKYGIGYLLTKFALNRANKIYSDKTADFEFLQKWFPKEKLQYIPPSISMKRFQTTENSFREKYNIAPSEIVISTIAMMRPDRKTEGVKFLMHALSKISHPFLWVMVGDGECKNELELLSEKLNLKNSVFVGKKNSAEVAEILLSSNLFVFPGIDEGFGFVFLEAQAAGLPVVAFDNGGIPDAVKNGETGFLTPPFDEKNFIEKIESLLRDSLIRTQMGNAAKKFVMAKFDRDRNYEKIVKDIISRN